MTLRNDSSSPSTPDADGRSAGSPELAELLSRVEDEMREGLQLIGYDFRYLYLNQAAAVEHGRKSKASLLGRTMQECYPGIEHTAMFQTLTECMHQRRSAHFENEFEYEDGVKRWFDIRMEPVPEGLALLSLDIDVAKRLERDLQEANAFEALGRLTGGAVHDFNNLLAAILVSCDFIADTTVSTEVVRDEVSQIRQATERGATLLRQLLAVGQRHSEDRRVAINAVLEALEPRLRRLLGDDIALEVALDPSVGEVRATAGDVDRLVMNLAINARDAIAGEGRVWLATLSVELTGEAPTPALTAGPYVRIRIRDDGVGMDAATLAQVFDPFFTTRRGTGGTGLGLHSCLSLAKELGGALVASSTPGSGSTFDAYLPVPSG